MTIKVLIAHPSAQVRRRTGALFAKLDWEALEAATADRALALCREHRPDVALLEAGMASPGSPDSLVDEVRSGCGTRVVLLQDELDAEVVLAGAAAGVDEYLLGSASPAEAAVRVRTAARVKELEAQVVSLERAALPTRPALAGLVRAQVSSARRHGRGLALLLVSVDDADPDEVAGALGERLRDEDVVGRWDDDRLLVVLPDAGRAGTAAVAEALRRDVIGVRVGGAVWAGENASALLARAEDALERLRVDAPPEPATSSVSVVLVDETPEIRQLLAAHLETTAVEVLGEASGLEDALQLLGVVRPDVVVMDMHEGLDEVRTVTERHPGVVVIGFTATDDHEVVRAMREAGAVQDFHKDELHELIAYLDSEALARAVSERRARQAPG